MKKRTIMKGLLCVAVGAIVAVTGYTLAYLTDRKEVWLCFCAIFLGFIGSIVWNIRLVVVWSDSVDPEIADRDDER